MTKMIKLSLAAAVAATGMSAAVVDNVKMNGKARLFYETTDKDSATLLDKSTSKGNLLLSLAASANVGPMTVNLRQNVMTTAGLEHTIVALPQSGYTDTMNYTDIANVSATVGGTTAIVGLQELNTPLCFTEGWNIHRNTFNATVVVNKSLVPSTTLVYADVKTTNAKDAGIQVDGAQDANVNASMVAAHTNIAGLPVNAYFYDLNEGAALYGATATWFDTSFNVAGAKVKAMYSQIDPENNAADTGSAAAISIAGKIAGLNVMAAYSSVSEDGVDFVNQATSKKTKLPTQAVYVDGRYVADAGATATKIKLSGFSLGPVKLAVQHVVADTDNGESTETDLIATTKVGPVALKALLMSVDRKADLSNTTGAEDLTRLRVYANYSF